jgi:hypothetical protein
MNFLLKSCHHAFDGDIFRVGFFWDRSNVHTFNLESRRLYKDRVFNHRTDRRVKGWLRRDGWMAGWVVGWCMRYGWIYG